MTDNTKPEALDLADWLEAVGGGPSAKRCAALLREQHARIAELESELEAVVAGGVQALSAAPGEPPGIRALMCVISSLRDTAHFSDEEGELTNDLRTLRDWAYAQTAAFQPSPTAQGATIASESGTPPVEQLATTTEGCMQPMPDKCDQDTWRGPYYHLPLSEQAAPKAAPAGWKLVPVEPTADQEWAGKNAALRCSTMGEACKIYKAMLAASPPAEQTFITPETGNSVSAKGAAITSESGAVYAELCCDEVSRAVDVVVERCISLTQDATGIKVAYDPIILANALRTELRGFADRTHALRMEQAAPKAAPAEVLGWIYEDELPESYPYSAMFLHSKVDTVRMFPVFGPTAAPGEPDYSEKWDAELGRTAMRFVDRAGDVHPGIDDAETICAEFHRAMSEVIERMPHVQRMTAPQQEAQEPATVPYQKLTNEIDLILTDPNTVLSFGARRALHWMRTWVSVPLFTAPQPAPDCHHRPPCAECAAQAKLGEKT